MSTQIPSPASRLAPTPTAGTAGKGKSGAVGRTRGGMQDAGVMRMTMAFIVWPALIGLSMAV